MLTASCWPERRSIRLMGNPASAPRLLGRETEVRILAGALDQAACGSLAIVLVEGEAGIGKTRLLEEALTGAAARGMQAAAGRAEELERARPFGLLAGAFGCVPGCADPRRAAIGELLAASGGISGPPVTVTSDPGLQFRVVDAFGDLVETLALSGPLVLGADDLQWADPSSLLTVAATARRLPGLPVAIIGCFRPVPRSAELDGLIRALQTSGARQLTLQPLEAEAVRELTCEAVAAEPGPGAPRPDRRNCGEPAVRHRATGRPAPRRRHPGRRGTGRGCRGDVAAVVAAYHLAADQLPASRHHPAAAGRVGSGIGVLAHRSGFDLRAAGDRADRGADRGDPGTCHRRRRHPAAIPA